MIIRNDLLSSATVIPEELQEVILRVGGTNIFGEPLFRLVLAECRTVKAAGAWSIWQKGLSVDDRGGLGIKDVIRLLKEGRSSAEINEYLRAARGAKPIGEIRGMVDRPLYPFTGFILEKWKPAESFGSPIDWEAVRFEGEPAAGPYPQYGDYELCAGPTPYMLTCQQVEDAIRQTFKMIEERPSTPQARMAQILEQMDIVEAAQARDTKNKSDAMQTEDNMLYATVSLGAGRVRQELAKKAGLKGHWGN